LQPDSALAFHRPLTATVKRTLTVSNSNASPVIFKVKTTAPKQYCVRPNSGRIEPGETVEVQVLLQPMKEDPPASYKCKDKFLVQSATVSPNHESLGGLPEMWSAIEKEDKSAIHEQKIRCAFLPPIDEAGTSNSSAFLSADNAGADSSFANAETSSEGRDSRFETVRGSGVSENYATPARSSILPPSYTNGQDSIPPQPSINLPTSSTVHPENHALDSTSTSSDTKPISQIAQEASSKPVMETLREAGNTIAAQASNVSATIVPAATSAGSTIAASAASAGSAIAEKTGYSGSTASSIPHKDDGPVVAALRKQLSAVEGERESLKVQLKEAKDANVLRQRNVGSASAASSSARTNVASLPSQVQTEGVPVQVVAGLCFGIFIFTWLFF